MPMKSNTTLSELINDINTVSLETIVIILKEQNKLIKELEERIYRLENHIDYD